MRGTVPIPIPAPFFPLRPFSFLSPPHLQTSSADLSGVFALEHKLKWRNGVPVTSFYCAVQRFFTFCRFLFKLFQHWERVFFLLCTSLESSQWRIHFSLFAQ